MQNTVKPKCAIVPYTVDATSERCQSCGMATTPEGDPRTLSDLVAEEIRVALTRQRMSQRGFAAKLGVSPAWLNYRLTGQQEIGLNDLFQIASVLGVDLDELLTPDVKAKATDTGKEAKRDFDPAPTESSVTKRHSFVDLAKGVIPTVQPRPGTPPNGQAKRVQNRPVSAVPARKRRPRPVLLGDRVSTQ